MDEEAPTIGSAKIKAVQVDEDSDGIDDETGNDGKRVMIETEAVSEDSKIFTSLRKASRALPLMVGSIYENESFEVLVNEPVDEDVEFDWWIVKGK